ncbi:MAG: DUF177 domain-containing protein [Candidatus Zixiibacteriota bacterium]|nr:MAG: DUF177 domain-containing protein [candidate division Zixibacteria bacterium]
MNLDLREFDAFPAEVSLDFEADSADFGIEGVSFRDLMSVRMTIQKVVEEYYCQGYVAVSVEEECSRCLEMFDSELSGDLTFIVKTDEGEAVMATDTRAEIVHVRSGEPVVEMNELIRQTLILSIPLKPLCSPECRGLCPSCGVNLNEETCTCKTEEIDDRWEGLSDLME